MQRVAVVSGGADGIGREVSLELLDAGYAVAAFDLKDDKIAELNETLKDKKFMALKCNAIDEESVKSSFAKVKDTFGRVDVLVNVVGGSMGVLVRHGSYISVYCNLASVSVSRGQKVSVRQVLGTVGKDNILQFQLRKERAKLNPEQWLAR